MTGVVRTFGDLLSQNRSIFSRNRIACEVELWVCNLFPINPVRIKCRGLSVSQIGGGYVPAIRLLN
jgi:hypothetical protein